MKTQQDLAYEERDKLQERVRFLTYIYEGRKGYEETYRYDDGDTYEGLQWYAHPDHAYAFYKNDLKLILVEDTPTIDPITRDITRNPL